MDEREVRELRARIEALEGQVFGLVLVLAENRKLPLDKIVDALEFTMLYGAARGSEASIAHGQALTKTLSVLALQKPSEMRAPIARLVQMLLGTPKRQRAALLTAFATLTTEEVRDEMDGAMKRFHEQYGELPRAKPVRSRASRKKR